MELNVEKVLHMNGGQGERSYSRNSSYQGNILCFLQPFLQECVSNMKIIPCERFCIADLGCSSGPNTLFIAETICKAIQGKYMASMALPIPQLQVFFSDLPSNDFNLLLRSLPLPPNQENDDDNNNDDDDDDNDDDKDRIPRCNYFAAAVAGSFHRRLFPTNSLHFVHSSFSLHWLSQVPAKIEDRTSGSWNKGRVFISKDSPVEVGEAYLIQFKKDFNSFLRARSEEVVGGGCMFLFLSGRPDSCEDPRDQGPIAISWEILQDSFNDMVLQGVIEEEKRDSFNLPFFSPSAKELRLELEKEGSFTVKRIEYLSEWGYSAQFDMEKRNNETFGKMVAIQTRVVLEGLISSHFGGDVVGLLFENFARRVADRASEVLNVSQYEGGKFFIVLERQ